MKLVVIVQARMGSSRLPGKVMLPLAGRPALFRQIERLRAAMTPFEIHVATTTDGGDDPIRALCREMDVPCFSGHPTDLLDRHYRAGLAASADAVAKIPSDCPLIDPGVVDRVLSKFVTEPGRWDLVTNLCPPTHPDGNDVEVMTFEALERAYRDARETFEREHTTPFIWDQPTRFRVANVTWETGLDYSRTHRLTMDYPEDYRLIRMVYDLLWSPTRPVFGLSEILDVLESHRLRSVNAALHGRSWRDAHASEFRSVRAIDGRIRWN